VLVVLWLTLQFAGLVRRLLGQAGIELVTRISGLLLTVIAVKPWPMRSASSFGKASDGPSA
jgi:small neutral amino acid transporter SnatA (MarC family)